MRCGLDIAGGFGQLELSALDLIIKYCEWVYINLKVRTKGLDVV